LGYISATETVDVSSTTFT